MFILIYGLLNFNCKITLLTNQNCCLSYICNTITNIF